MNSIDDVLYAACVTACGPAPSEASQHPAWVGRIGQLYTAIERDKKRLAKHLELIAKIEAPKESRERGYGIVAGKLVSVEESFGRALITVETTSGNSDYDDDGITTFRSDWLNTPEGASQAEAAQSLIGKQVRVWKYPEQHSKRPGQTVRMFAHIEGVGQNVDHGGQDRTAHAASSPAPVVTESAEVAQVDDAPVESDAVAHDSVAVEEPSVVQYAIDGTALDDLRDAQPSSIREVRSWATQYLGFDQDQVTQIARRILQPGQGGQDRTPAELRTVWRALLAHFIKEAQPA